MLIQLKKYQEIAIKELLEDSKKLLKRSGSKKLIFKAPTGSGKTVVMAEFIKLLISDPEVKDQLVFIWTAPRKLHDQSKEKLEDYFENTRALVCSSFEDLDDRQIQENEILFFNWESINKKDNVYIRENEKENNLSAVLDRTRDAGRKIILVIDESHHHATSEISQSLINDINPSLTIEVSATPVVKDPDEVTTVDLEDVKLEGVIKKSVLLNPGFENLLRGKKIKSKLAGGTDSLVLEQAFEKRKELLKAYKDEKVDINPLVLIQLPDRRTRMEEELKENVIKILKNKYKITTENGKLAIYLSENKENLENIAKPNHEAEVLIFKQAIALGWDCPRAHILVLFRDWKSFIFSIQTIGRIMRMPEPVKGYYENDQLNHGYVFTNLENIEIREDVARSYVTIYTTKRIKNYEPIKLLSVYKERFREKTRLSPLFIEIFLEESKKYNLRKKIRISKQKAQLSLISDWKAEALDKIPEEGIKAELTLDPDNPVDLQKLFDFFVRRNLSPFYPEDRSIGRVKESIYKFFNKEIKMDYKEEFEKILNIVLSEKNNNHFISVIDAAKEKYIKQTQEKDEDLKQIKEWGVPENLSFGGDYVKKDVKLSVMQPFYSDEKWKTEKAFIKYLEDNSEKIEWWFKNGDRDATFFAVEYEENDGKKPFYVDFIVKLKSGEIGLLDTKSGITIKDAREKSDGLRKYIERQNKKGGQFFGGITANTNSENFKGRWMVFTRKSSDLNPEDFDNWELLEF